MRFLIPIFLFTGCTFSNPNIIEKVSLNLPSQEPLELEDVEFDDNFCMDENNFKRLLLNLKQIEQYILMNNEIIEIYRDYYEKK